MFSINQQRILDLLRKNVFLECSILQLSKKLKKSYQRIYDAVQELEKDNILKIKKAGQSSIVSLALTPQAIAQISFLDEQEAMHKKLPNYEKIISLREISSHLIIVTGSYAKGTQRKDSDFDMVVVVPNNQKAIDVQKSVENLTLMFHPKVHLYVFTHQDFMEMLLGKEENYGKEIFKNHVILKNAHAYYEILKEAIEHGFKG